MQNLSPDYSNYTNELPKMYKSETFQSKVSYSGGLLNDLENTRKIKILPKSVSFSKIKHRRTSTLICLGIVISIIHET